jgi:hypothetical protein
LITLKDRRDGVADEFRTLQSESRNLRGVSNVVVHYDEFSFFEVSLINKDDWKIKPSVEETFDYAMKVLDHG